MGRAQHVARVPLQIKGNRVRVVQETIRSHKQLNYKSATIPAVRIRVLCVLGPDCFNLCHLDLFRSVYCSTVPVFKISILVHDWIRIQNLDHCCVYSLYRDSNHRKIARRRRRGRRAKGGGGSRLSSLKGQRRGGRRGSTDHGAPPAILYNVVLSLFIHLIVSSSKKLLRLFVRCQFQTPFQFAFPLLICGPRGTVDPRWS